MLLSWLNDFRYVLLNGSEKCKGKITWSQRGMSSTIDFALVNDKMHQWIGGMMIDESKEICDLSDHNLIQIDIEIPSSDPLKSSDNTVVEREYYSTDNGKLGEFVINMEKELGNVNVENMHDFNQVVKKIAQQTLLMK